jgi:hypothetical protein
MVRALMEDVVEVFCLAAFLAGLATLAQPGLATLIG